VVRSAIAPDEAILAEARRRGSNLIVMGVAGRPGENLFFGDTAASVLEKTPTSVLFLSTWANRPLPDALSPVLARWGEDQTTVPSRR
jgi:hypothetical protein